MFLIHWVRSYFVADTLLGVAFKIVVFLGSMVIPFGFVLTWPLLSSHGHMVLVKRRAQAIAQNKGLSFERYIEGSRAGAIVDVGANKIAFVTLNDEHHFDFGEIVDLSWEWVEKNGKKIACELVFRTRNEAVPHVKVGRLSDGEAETWFNRLRLVLHLG